MNTVKSRILFPPGQIVATPGALEALERNGEPPLRYIKRHLSGDWGEVCPEDAQSNQDALQEGNRLMSVYSLSDGTKIWVITEWDRSVTTILLPEEY